ncbi:MAG: hypothetical protein JO097_03775 [Acidobacteriaceae bacterium]|nr:hypothetical protein [Acidobacteriaceae bacterium]MBV9297050.1 hypothetical protein [Acidobacteriaceae bacterium]MBV9765591.1 hypothetical protein [Acidobacteriaceae bacterium]
MITREQAIQMFRSNDLIGIGMEADAVRKRLHPELIVSYSLEGGPEPSPSIAALHFDGRQTLEERVEELENLRRVQEETGELMAVNPSFTGTAVEYLKTLAVSRIYLDNISHVQSSPSAAGAKVCQIALRFGANDLGAIGNGPTEEEIRRLIRDAGFVPKQRDALFRSLFWN